ncbi:MAG: sulfatase [Planctomycetota bacterium]|nr:sulfatase [Planctomycetota bacterium]
MMMRWQGYLWAVMACMMCWGSAEAADQQRPNVLFIAVDDLNDWISCLGGHPDCKTPNIDRLAKRGVLFAQAHCAAPACNPSRAALMTGIRPSTSGVYLNPQPWRPAMPNVMTLPQLFMKHGYHAQGGGKIYHGRYDDDQSWHAYFKKTTDPKPVDRILKDPHSRAGGIVWGRLQVPDRQMNDYKVASWAIDYLKKEHDRPFFLACGIFRPHMPWQVPDKYYDLYPRKSVTLPRVPADDLDDLPAAGVKMAKPDGDHKKVIDTNNWKYAVQGYLASIAFADAQVGRVLDALDRSPHRDNTIVCLWGDHGWHLGEKHHWRKFSLWEEATRAPLMFAGPGIVSTGAVCQRPVDFMNIYPTLAELCDLPLPDHLEGISMTGLLKDPKLTWDRPALTTHGRKNHALRSERWRYIRYADGSEELYDHEQDPMEWKNLAQQSKYAGVKKKLSAWFPQNDAPDAPFDPAVRKSNKNNNKSKKNKSS